MLSGRGLCVGLITRLEECDREALIMGVGGFWPPQGLLRNVGVVINTLVSLFDTNNLTNTMCIFWTQ